VSGHSSTRLNVGYAITDQKKYLDFQLKKYELESLQDDRITVAVEVCGVCGSVRLSPLSTAYDHTCPPSPSLIKSDRNGVGADRQDHHTLAGGWGSWVTPFVVAGHEVIGKVVEVGKEIKEFKVGDRVGVGAQVSACGECKACKKDLGQSSLRLESLSGLTSRELLSCQD